MQPEDLNATTAGQMQRQPLPPCGVLGEDQRLLAGLKNLRQQLLAALQLAGASRQIGAVVEVMGGMIADLLEPRESGQHEPLAGDALTGIGLCSINSSATA